ncbi:MAG: serine/threonine protein kinase, partial [Candidatus Obscuribacterales bacterium]|nr:serine/threonine protein kinase [Candidatus Obscuribacterales bacterium]
MDLKSLPGKIILNSYEVLKIIGSGGMGTVYQARQIDLDRLVAIKILDPVAVADDEALLRFEREAKTISQLSHQHITQFYSYGVISENNPFIVMEFVDGVILSQLIVNAQSAIPCLQAVKIAIQVAEALGYAHAHGIVHRDLKPDNIMILSKPEADFVKLLDFGLSKIASGNEEQRLTQTGAVMGTPRYMSPEQSMGQKIDLRADIYSFGCILYEMVCGKVPFDADNPVGIIYKHTNEKPQRPSVLAHGGLPAGLELLILKCLEKDPAARYQSMDALLHDLRLIQKKNGDLIDIQLSYEVKQASNNRLTNLAAVAWVMTILIIGAGALVFYTNAQRKAAQSEQKYIVGKNNSSFTIQTKVSPVQQLKQIEGLMIDPSTVNRGELLQKIPLSIDELLKTQKLS